MATTATDPLHRRAHPEGLRAFAAPTRQLGITAFPSGGLVLQKKFGLSDADILVNYPTLTGEDLTAAWPITKKSPWKSNNGFGSTIRREMSHPERHHRQRRHCGEATRPHRHGSDGGLRPAAHAGRPVGRMAGLSRRSGRCRTGDLHLAALPTGSAASPPCARRNVHVRSSMNFSLQSRRPYRTSRRPRQSEYRRFRCARTGGHSSGGQSSPITGGTSSDCTADRRSIPESLYSQTTRTTWGSPHESTRP